MTILSMSIDESIKTQAEELFSDIGLTMTTAINLFLRVAIREQKIPFELSRQTQSIATADELQAIKEFEASFEKKPILIDAEESYKKARQVHNAEYVTKLVRSYEQAVSGSIVDHDLIGGD